MAKLRPYRLRFRPVRRPYQLKFNLDFNLVKSEPKFLKFILKPPTAPMGWLEERDRLRPADFERLRTAIKPVAEAMRLMASTIQCLPPAWLERFKAQQDELAAQQRRAALELELELATDNRRRYIDQLLKGASVFVPPFPMLLHSPICF
jgi:hypothetical protein